MSVRDLLLCAKHLFIAAKRSSSQRSLPDHLDRGFDGIFEIIRVVGRHLISIAEVHAIVARAKLAQGKPEMARVRLSAIVAACASAYSRSRALTLAMAASISPARLTWASTASTMSCLRASSLRVRK